MPPVLVVETVTGRSMAEIRVARDRSSADLVELRLDGVDDVDVAGALKDRKKPVIVTCRPVWEGGRFDGPEETRLRLLADAIHAGAEYVDVEWRADRRALPASATTRLVLSHHDFGRLPPDLAERVRAMRRERAGIVKVAVTPACLRDCIAFRDTMTMDEAHIAIAMGSKGQLSRLCPWLFGSCWTYGGTAAPGQVSAHALTYRYRIPRGTMETTIFAIAGSPLAHSASPAMHNAAFAALGMNAVYVPLETADAAELFAVADAISLRGASITAPLKQAIRERAADVDDLAAQTGSANTIRRRERGWEARNFDVAGFLAPLTRGGRSLRGVQAVVLGAGGTARTASWALQREGAAVAVAARRQDRAEALAAELQVQTSSWPPEPGWDLLVNTTPVGTWPRVDEAPIERHAVRGRMVYDLVYNPSETTLLAWAREGGAETIDGLDMLVSQACLQFEWWTGHPAPAAIMQAAAEAFIAERRAHAS